VPKLIAIIDDEPDMEFYFSVLFDKAIQRKLVKIKFFQDSRKFYEWFMTNEPDLVLSDINMPHISGPELSKSIRLAGRSVPIYFISGYAEKDYQELLSEIGLCRFLAKPLNPVQFNGLIELDLNLPLA
jgi:DNA-binding NtrC family response regulator